MVNPKASNTHQFILVAIDYFIKRVEEASHTNLTEVMSGLIYQEVSFASSIYLSPL